jgi:hypothetical protein
MPIFSSLLYDGAVAVGTSALLYSITVTTAAFTALLARTAERRRAALDVLRALLRRRGER